MIKFMEENTQQQEQATPNEIAENTAKFFATLPRTDAENTAPAVATSATTTQPLRDTSEVQTFKPDSSLLNLKQVKIMFQKAGVPRGSRSIERYCQLGKLDAQQDPNTRSYYATVASVQTLINHFKEQQQLRQEALGDEIESKLSDIRETVDERSSTGERHTLNDEIQTPKMSRNENQSETSLDKLQAKIFKLEAEQSAKDAIIERLYSALNQNTEMFASRIAEQAHRAGLAEGKLKAIEAPKNRGGENTTHITDATIIDAYRANDDDLEGNEGKD
jgi:hypothetical protein